jgi:hypothetical protein
MHFTRREVENMLKHIALFKLWDTAEGASKDQNGLK